LNVLRTASDTKILTIKTAIYTYPDTPGVVSFDITFDFNLFSYKHSESSWTGVISSFPSFVVEQGNVERGWMTWSGNSESGAEGVVF
jgi:hypothetical protein